MDPKSALQQQYPLSPKKFWKKLIPQIIPYYILSLLIVGVLGAIGIGASGATFSPWDIVGVIIVALVPMVIFLALYGLYVKAYIRRYYYDAGDNFVTIKKGVFAPAEIHVQYQKIQDVYVDQDIFDRILGLYDVHIASATVSSGIEAHIDGVDKTSADALKNMLLNKIQGKSMPMNAGAGGMQTGAAAGQGGAGLGAGPITASFSEEISSKTYPISGRWMTVSALGSVVSSLFFSIIITSWVAFPGKDGNVSVLQAIGFGDYGFLFWFVVFAIFFIGHILYLVLWKKNFTFQFMPEYIFVRTGIIGKQEKHVPYNTLQDVGISQGVFERMFGLASVKIENASSGQVARVGRNGQPIFNGIMIPGQTPANAQKITEALKNVILSKSSGPSSTGV